MKRKYPPRVTASHGALYYIEDTEQRNAKGRPIQKWRYLCRIDAGPSAMHEALAKLLTDRDHLPCSVSAVVKAWKADVLDKRYAAHTRTDYGRMADVIAVAFKDFHDIAEVRPTNIAEFIDDGWADKARTAKKYKALFSLIMTYAIRKGYRDQNPAREVDMGAYTEEKRKRYITDDELERIRAAARAQPKAGAMIECMIDLAVITGQRIGDVLALTWADVSQQGIMFKPAKVRHSTGVAVPVRMTEQLEAVLRRAKSIGKIKGVNVIHTLRGRAYDYHGAHTAWRRACHAAGVANAWLHDLRRRTLTDAKRQQLDAQALGGHADAKMTEHYIQKLDVQWIEPPKIAVIK